MSNFCHKNGPAMPKSVGHNKILLVVPQSRLLLSLEVYRYHIAAGGGGGGGYFYESWADIDVSCARNRVSGACARSLASAR